MQRIFVGDVQGCADELEELLARARQRFGDGFELWLVGDLVNRGPASLRVLRRVRELVEAGRARCVLGNHEVGLLRVAAGLVPPGPLDTFGEVLEARDAADWIEWLRRLPLLEVGRLGSQRFALLHAAAHPDWSLGELERRARALAGRLAAASGSELSGLLAPPGTPVAGMQAERDLLGRLTRCRSASESGLWSDQPPELAPPGYEAWHRVWSRRAPDYAVVYGHWARQGLHVAPKLRGLDTGCVHHGHGRKGMLTAWLPSPDAQTPFDLPDESFWQIPARRVYYED